ncbi:hypothetical protein D3C81_1851050 [compost metagenome]
MQIDPAPYLAINAFNGRSRAPISLLDSWLEKNNSLQLPNNVMPLLKLIAKCGRKIHGIAPLRDVRQKPPVFFTNFHHMVDPWVISVGHFS